MFREGKSREKSGVGVVPGTSTVRVPYQVQCSYEYLRTFVSESCVVVARRRQCTVLALVQYSTSML